MNNNIEIISSWMEALISAANEMAVDAMGLSEGVTGEMSFDLPGKGSSTFVALVGDEEQVQVGLAADGDNCERLISFFLGMEPGEEELCQEDIMDALGEVANVLAGGVKTRMAASDKGTMSMGLPLVIQGTVKAPNNASIASSKITWDSVDAHLILLHNIKNK